MNSYEEEDVTVKKDLNDYISPSITATNTS